MKRYLIPGLLLMCLTALLVTPIYGEEVYKGTSPSKSYSRSDAVFMDVFVVRPASLAGCVLGLVGTIISVPFAFTEENKSIVYEEFLARPFSYTFKRPLGDMDY